MTILLLSGLYVFAVFTMLSLVGATRRAERRCERLRQSAVLQAAHATALHDTHARAKQFGGSRIAQQASRTA